MITCILLLSWRSENLALTLGPDARSRSYFPLYCLTHGMVKWPSMEPCQDRAVFRVKNSGWGAGYWDGKYWICAVSHSTEEVYHGLPLGMTAPCSKGLAWSLILLKRQTGIFSCLAVEKLKARRSLCAVLFNLLFRLQDSLALPCADYLTFCILNYVTRKYLIHISVWVQGKDWSS